VTITSPSPSGRSTAFLVLVALAALVVLVWSTRRVAVEPRVEVATESAAGTVPFLMEQQWAIRMKLALAETATFRHKVESTGRVVPAFRHYGPTSSL
jgi:hypothetical protein